MMETDVVCGMDVDVAHALSSQYQRQGVLSGSRAMPAPTNSQLTRLRRI